jgi:acetyl esterase/lipase
MLGEPGFDVEIAVWPELWHVFQLFAPALPEAIEAIAKIAAFTRAALGICDAQAAT